jgi:hypothetical protein
MVHRYQAHPALHIGIDHPCTLKCYKSLVCMFIKHLFYTDMFWTTYLLFIVLNYFIFYLQYVTAKWSKQDLNMTFEQYLSSCLQMTNKDFQIDILYIYFLQYLVQCANMHYHFHFIVVIIIIVYLTDAELKWTGESRWDQYVHKMK